MTRRHWPVGAALAALHAAAPAQGVYYTDEAFLAQVFGEAAVPAPALLWPTPALQQRMQAVLGHPYRQLRLRYWRVGERTAWILSDVGKSEDITLGFVVEQGAIVRTDVLVFRETRGWEIRHPAFTRRFVGARLTPTDTLNKPIDGITGATLSVAAYQRMARLALLLHQAVAGG